MFTVLFSNTFHIFRYRKDDSEFFAGDIVSKIIVPHPALGFPTTLSLNYKPYSGWLSKGLPHWDIDKVVLTDSYGRSYSLCKPNTKLSSGAPVRFKLKPGNCELDNQDEYGAFTSKPSTTTDIPDSVGQESINLPEADAIETIKKRKNFLNLGTSFKLEENQSYPLDDSGDLPWQPILEGNSLDKELGESSRSFSSQPEEIYEPILNDKRLNVNRARNLHEEIVEPVLKATTPRVKKGKEIVLTEEESFVPEKTQRPEFIKITTITKTEKPKSNSEEQTITVQLFPFRLGELLQRAERYARETILPLISVQAPRFFGFNFTPSEINVKSETRKPRYIPRFEEPSAKNKIKNQTKAGNARITNESSESREQRNIFELLRPTTTTAVSNLQPENEQETQESRNEVAYYTNVLRTESRSLRPEDPEYEPVFIDLPTFRPPKAKAKRSIPLTYKRRILRQP